MTRLYQRDIRLTVGEPGTTKAIELRSTVEGGEDQEGLCIEFDVTRTLTREPNTADIKIYNLSPTLRQKLGSARFLQVQLEVDYVSDRRFQPTVIFKGDLFDTTHERKGPEIVTTLSVGDGALAKRTGRINKSFRPGTSVSSIVKELVSKLVDEDKLVDAGNLREVISNGLRLEDVSDTFAGGYVASGKAIVVLERLLRSCGYELSIQDNKLQAIQRGVPLNKRALELSSESGLISSPTVSARSIVKAKTLILPDLFPGRVVVFKNVRDIEDSTEYRVERVDYTGSSFGTDYYADIECKTLNVTRRRV